VSSREEEREWVARELEARSLIPSPAKQAEIRAEAERLARRVTRRRRVTPHQAIVVLLDKRELSDE
jgi:hypothetical protein